MSNLDPEISELEQRAKDGDTEALATLFDKYQPRLRRMIDLRMDRRVQARVNTSDVLQDAYIDLVDQLGNYIKDPKLPFFIWMRRLTGQRLMKCHREHLGADKRNVGMEVAIQRRPTPAATSFALASELVGKFTGPVTNAVRMERQANLQEVLQSMSEDDCEIIALRHFEQLTNVEVAAALDMSEAAAGMRYLRALRRLKNEMKQMLELFGDSGFLRNDDSEGSS